MLQPANRLQELLAERFRAPSNIFQENAMKQLLTFLTLLTTVLVFLPLQGTGQNQNPYRTWRDRSGTYEISARLIRISEKEIEL